jgi:hypothetical protein
MLDAESSSDKLNYRLHEPLGRNCVLQFVQ